MRITIALLVLCVSASTAPAGLHVSTESFRELPSDWRGFLPDHRALRAAAAGTGPLRDGYADAASRLASAARTRPLTADEAADLGGLYVRLGEPTKAVEVLRPAARAHPDHFRTLANLGTAWQLAGDLDQAAAALEDAVRLAPEPLKPAERLHLKLVRLRQKEGTAAAKPADAPDDFSDIRPPAEAVPLVQRLALWLPADGRVLWQLGETAHALGDPRTAANVLDGCVTEYGMKSETLRRHRQTYRAEADALEQRVGHRSEAGVAFRSARPLARSFDPARLPAVKPDGVNPLPWPALTDTEIGKGFKPAFLRYVEALDGKRVAVAGHVAGGGGRGPDDAGFLLTEYPVGCWFCETPGPAQVVAVELAPGATAPDRGAVKAAGVLRLNRTDPERYLFTLTGATVGAAD